MNDSNLEFMNLPGGFITGIALDIYTWKNNKTKKTNMASSSAPSAPKKITWIIGLICGLLGILGHYVHIQILTEYNYALLLVGFIALAVGTSFREL